MLAAAICDVAVWLRSSAHLIQRDELVCCAPVLLIACSSSASRPCPCFRMHSSCKCSEWPILTCTLVPLTLCTWSQVFPLLRKGKAAGAVAGCRVSEGSIQRSAPLFRVLRGEQVVYEGPCTNLRRHKLDVDAVGKSNDCGVVLGDGAFGDYRPGDVVQCVERVSRRASVEH